MLLLRALQEKRRKPIGSTKEYFDSSGWLPPMSSLPSEKDAREDFRSTGHHEFANFQDSYTGRMLGRHPSSAAYLKLTCAKAHVFRGFDRLAEAALPEYPWPGISVTEECNRSSRTHLPGRAMDSFQT